MGSVSGGAICYKERSKLVNPIYFKSLIDQRQLLLQNIPEFSVIWNQDVGARLARPSKIAQALVCAEPLPHADRG